MAQSRAASAALGRRCGNLGFLRDGCGGDAAAPTREELVQRTLPSRQKRRREVVARAGVEVRSRGLKGSVGGLVDCARERGLGSAVGAMCVSDTARTARPCSIVRGGVRFCCWVADELTIVWATKAMWVAHGNTRTTLDAAAFGETLRRPSMATSVLRAHCVVLGVNTRMSSVLRYLGDAGVRAFTLSSRARYRPDGTP